MISPLKGLSSQTVRFSATLEERNTAARELRKGMPDARLMGRTLTMNTGSGDHSGQVSQYIVWDTPSEQFHFRSDFYKLSYGHYERTTQDQPLAHGLHLSDDFVVGAVVDQKNKRIYLPNGGWIDGPTGETYTVQGMPLGDVARHTKEC